MYGLRRMSRIMPCRCHCPGRLIRSILSFGILVLLITGCVPTHSPGPSVGQDQVTEHTEGTIVLKPDYQNLKDDFFGGSTACDTCHSAIYKRWKDSAHGKEFNRVYSDSPHEGPCLRCHTTGDESGVGCEACHGPRGSHVKLPGAFHDTDCRLCEITRECIRCHTRSIDPEFNVARGWKEIGHGHE